MMEQTIHITFPLYAESIDGMWLPSQRTSNAEIISMSWRHRVLTPCRPHSCAARYGCWQSGCGRCNHSYRRWSPRGWNKRRLTWRWTEFDGSIHDETYTANRAQPPLCRPSSAKATEILKTILSMSIKYRSDANVSDRYLIDVDPRVFAIWGHLQTKSSSAGSIYI